MLIPHLLALATFTVGDQPAACVEQLKVLARADGATAKLGLPGHSLGVDAKPLFAFRNTTFVRMYDGAIDPASSYVVACDSRLDLPWCVIGCGPERFGESVRQWQVESPLTDAELVSISEKYFRYVEDIKPGLLLTSRESLDCAPGITTLVPPVVSRDDSRVTVAGTICSKAASGVQRVEVSFTPEGLAVTARETLRPFLKQFRY